MGKIQNQKSGPPKIDKDEGTNKKKSGRPSNGYIETAFINTIRDVKLQAINADTQLQLQMAFFTNQDDKKSRRKEESLVSEKWPKIFLFNSLTSQEKNTLHQSYDKYIQKWKFEQIQQESDFPEYFFDDSNDLAFILNQLINARKKEISTDNLHLNSDKKDRNCYQIKAQEMFYLCLLCFKQIFNKFSSQESLRDIVLQFLLKNENLIINLLKASIEKAKTKYSEKTKKNKQNYKPIDQREACQTIKSSQIQNNQFQQQHTQHSKLKTQKKKIQKSKKRQNQNNDISIESENSQEPMTQKQKQEKLILCFVNYISWSFFYVYGEQGDPIKDTEQFDQQVLSNNKTQ